MKNFFRKHADDILILGGCMLGLVFVYQVWPMGTWLVAGVMCIAAGVLIGLAGGRQ